VTYRVVVARSAARRIAEKLPNPVAAGCVGLIFGALAAGRAKVGAPLRKPFEGQRRARRGEYRHGEASDRAERL
jgi:mRNA-degrading endonuclease RelE of RelBE toxin-antitoxin system